MKRGMKILLIILVILVVIGVIALLFINLWPSFGKKPSKDDKEGYALRSQYFIDGKFTNIDNFEKIVKVEGRSMFKDMFISYPNVKPEEKLKVESIISLPKANYDDMKVTWLGHSTILLQLNGYNILMDPVFSEIVSPVSFIGSKRYSEVAMNIEDLPEIDMVLISHNHYDHLDYNTIKEIDSKVKEYFVPLGVESYLKSWDIKEEKINEMAWYEEISRGGLNIALTPAQHFSGRNINDSDESLWGGFFLKNNYYSFYFTGDTGYGSFFKDIYEKYGEVDLIMADSSQYNELWPMVHMNPEQTIKASEDVKAKWLIPIHWGAFSLANHPWYEPGEIATILSENSKVKVATPKIGITVDYKEIEKHQEKWWEQ